MMPEIKLLVTMRFGGLGWRLKAGTRDGTRERRSRDSKRGWEIFSQKHFDFEK